MMLPNPINIQPHAIGQFNLFQQLLHAFFRVRHNARTNRHLHKTIDPNLHAITSATPLSVRCSTTIINPTTTPG